MALNREISLESGDIHLTIKETGESIDFNPEDMAFVRRYYEIGAEIETQQKMFKEKDAIIKKMPHKTPSEKRKQDEANLNLMDKFCEYCESLYDSLLGEGASVKIFAGQRVIGKYLVFLERLKPIIEESRNSLMADYEK